uniref:WAP domain-containing protein n=1 Tax=Salarias fasciatus TaxID=181472 RepID=A0A672FC76_SALFA
WYTYWTFTCVRGTFCAFKKAGKCPPPHLGRDLSQCAHACVNDNDCPGEKKCCTKKCGRTCVAPFKVKPGRCLKPSGFGICVNFCSTDSNCPKTEKCCSNGCGHNPTQNMHEPCVKHF